MKSTVIAIAMSLSVVSLAAEAAADTLLMKDGTRVQGTVVGMASRSLTFRHANDGVAHRYQMTLIDELRFTDDRAGRREAARRLEAPAGTDLVVQTVEIIDSRHAAANQTFSALLERAVTDASGTVIIPERSSAQLVLTRLPKRGATDSPEMVLDIQSITVHGKRYLVSTAGLERDSGTGVGKNKRTAEMVGGGAVLGSIIGAIAGGGKGAAIGAIVGGAGGAGAQIITRGHDVRVPAETVLTFTLDRAIALQPEW